MIRKILYQASFLQTGVLLLLLFFSCNGESADTAVRGKDTEVEKAVIEKIKTLPGYGAVQVEVRDGIAFLTGQCEGEGCSGRLVAQIEKVEGVIAVENDISEGEPVKY